VIKTHVDIRFCLFLLYVDKLKEKRNEISTSVNSIFQRYI